MQCNLESVVKMNHNTLNRYFTKKFIMTMLHSSNFNSENFINELENNYRILNDEYRNEFYYKNVLFNKYVLGKYSLNTSSAFSELNVVNSKADFVVINHSVGHLFEIKTELDNLDRLLYQLDDYYKVFSLVNVVTSENFYYPVYKLIKENNPNVGIIVLNKSGNLSIRKKAILDESQLNHDELFKLLRKKEYEELVNKEFNTILNVKPVYAYKAYLEKFREINIIDAQMKVFKILNMRDRVNSISLIKYLPYPIRWLVYSGKYNDEELYNVYKKLN